MAKTKSKKAYEVDFRKVSQTIKKMNIKNYSKESLEELAKELDYSLNSKARILHLRGKMVASFKQWEKE